MKQFTSTQSQNLVVQGALSVGASVLIGTLSAILQYLLRGGHVDVGTAASVGGAALITIGGAALKAYVPGHARELVQAGQDTIAQLQQANAALTAQLSARTDVQQALTQLQLQQRDHAQTLAQQVAQSTAQSVNEVIQQYLTAQTVPLPDAAPTTPAPVAQTQPTAPPVVQPPAPFNPFGVDFQITAPVPAVTGRQPS